MAIGEIVTQADLASLAREAEKNISTRAYLAPTVYHYANNAQPNWMYFTSLATAIKQWQYVMNMPGATAQKPAGNISFTTAATTLGINVDFYFNLPVAGWVNVPYSILRQVYSKKVVIPFRFYKTDGSGPYYSVLDNSVLGISATTLASVTQSKIQALDDFHRQVQLLKAKYNTLALYLNNLSKKPLNAVQQQSFNEGILLLQNLKSEMTGIQGIEFSYSANGQINGVGFIPIIYIVLAVLLAGTAAWTIDRLYTESQKTARINSSYDMQQWISGQKIKIAAAVKAGTISSSDANGMYADLDNSAKAAQDIATAASANTPGILDKVQDIALIALGIFAISKFVK